MDGVLTVQLPQSYVCGTCESFNVTSVANVSLEPLFDDHGELIGLNTVARYPVCGHRLPQVRMYEEDVAMVMESPNADHVLKAYILMEDEDDEYGDE